MSIAYRSILLCAFMVSFFGNVFSQESLSGYIITANNDTISGYIKISEHNRANQVCEFKTHVDEDYERYTVDDIVEFKVDEGRYFIAKDILLDDLSKKVFVEFVVNGIVDLFYYKERGQTYFFIEDDKELVKLHNDPIQFSDASGKTFSRESNQYKGALAYLFKDSPEVSEEARNINYNYNNFVKITENYHNAVCDSYECINYKKKETKILTLEFSLDMKLSAMGFKTSNDNAFDIMPSFGMDLNYKPTLMSSRWKLGFGAYLSGNTFEGDFENNLNGKSSRKYRLYTSYYMIGLPLYVSCDLSKNLKWTPSIQVGYDPVFLINPEYDVHTYMYIGNAEAEPVLVEDKLRNFQHGFFIGFKLKQKLKTNRFLTYKVNYEYRVPGMVSGYILDYIHINSFLFGVSYGFSLKD